MLQRVKKQADEFDLIHFHTDLFHLPVFEEMAANTITTLHGRLDLEALPELYRRWSMYPLVSISYSQRKPLKNAFWSATIYHGIGGDRLGMTPLPRGKYVAFLGRIAPEKGSDRAIRIAQAAGVPLKIAAKVGRDDEDYFCGAIRPMLRMGETEFIGEIGEKQKAEFLGNAAALLFPIDWPEPFGLVMIEAMACGTPVIAWNCGSVPEIIEDGVTGFIVSDEIAAARAIARAARLDRKQIREAFEKRFTAKRMAEEYVRLYETILWRPGMPRAQFSAIPRANTPTWGFEREETLSCLQVPVSGAEGAI
jgi:glycosyltransferase involved in cell wall biosynthesis